MLNNSGFGDVEFVCYVILILYIVNKMVEDMDVFFIFGDDLEVILDVLEEEEGVYEEFLVVVSNV